MNLLTSASLALAIIVFSCVIVAVITLLTYFFGVWFVATTALIFIFAMTTYVVHVTRNEKSPK